MLHPEVGRGPLKPGFGLSGDVHHPWPKSIDIRPVARDDRDLIGAVSTPSTKTALEAAPNPFSALFDNLSCWFLKTLPASPLNPKTWRETLAKSLIPKDRRWEGGGSPGTD